MKKSNKLLIKLIIIIILTFTVFMVLKGCSKKNSMNVEINYKTITR